MSDVLRNPRFWVSLTAVVVTAVVFPALGWTSWFLEELAIGVVAMLAVGLCFPVYFGLKEPPLHD
jgi:hypothetical protein